MADLQSFHAEAITPITIYGKHLTLEPYDKDKHLNGLWTSLGGAAEINQKLRYFPISKISDPEALGQIPNSVTQGSKMITMVAIKKDTGEVAGMASYMRQDPKNGVVEIGCVAHGSAMVRSSLGTEMHYLLAKHVFEDLKYRRYEWKCDNANLTSKSSALRLGFKFEGIFRQHMVVKGLNRDTAWYSMIDNEWDVLGRSFESWLDTTNFAESTGMQKRKLEEIRNEYVQATNSV